MQLLDTYKQYVAALLLFNNQDPSDWDRAFKELDIIYPYLFASDERTDKAHPDKPGLIELARGGDNRARVELGRRAQIYDAYLIYWRPYSKPAWDAARSTVKRLSVNDDGSSYLAQILLLMSINGQFRQIWAEIRFQLVEIGEPARLLLSAFAEAKVKETPETVIFKEDDLVQIFAAIAQFGDPTSAVIRGYLTHPNHNIRKAAVRAVGEAKAVHYLDDINALLLESTSPHSWIVRAAAAEAFTNFESARAKAGPMLLVALKAEAKRAGDPEGRSLVIKRIYQALGKVHYVDAVPELVKDLDVPNVEWRHEIMSALYHITTKKEIVSPAEWKSWYRTSYAQWREEWRKKYNE